VQAQKAIDAKRYPDAIRICDAVIAAEPENAEAYKVRGLARMSAPLQPWQPPPRTVWNAHRPRYGGDPPFVQREPARRDLHKAGELRDNKDPVVWYLLSVLHTDIARNDWDRAPVEDLEHAIKALDEAQRLDPKNPAYARAREVLVPQLFFAHRDSDTKQEPYNGEYANVIPMGAKEPFGESMKRKGWVPGKTWTAPPMGTTAWNDGRGSGGSSSGSSEDDASMYILLGIGAVLVMSEMNERSSGGASRSGGFNPCTTCRGGKYFNDYDYARKVPVLRPCGGCNGSGMGR
jgi:tetratricopeptide (TPR) repeat protein